MEEVKIKVGFESKFVGTPITIEENGDLIFHCGSKNKAKQLLHLLCRDLFLKKEERDNE